MGDGTPLTDFGTRANRRELAEMLSRDVGSNESTYSSPCLDRGARSQLSGSKCDSCQIGI
jgi:hypothetical protein